MLDFVTKKSQGRLFVDNVWTKICFVFFRSKKNEANSKNQNFCGRNRLPSLQYPVIPWLFCRCITDQHSIPRLLFFPWLMHWSFLLSTILLTWAKLFANLVSRLFAISPFSDKRIIITLSPWEASYCYLFPLSLSITALPSAAPQLCFPGWHSVCLTHSPRQSPTCHHFPEIQRVQVTLYHLVFF